MKIKKSKSNYFWAYLLILSCLILTFQKVKSQSSDSSNTQRQYRSYSSFSPSSPTDQDDLSNGSQTVTDLKNNRIEDTSASRRSSDGLNKNGQSIFYYEMLPASRQHDPRQLCTYDGGEMKCSFKRESGSQQGSYQNVDATVSQDIYSVPANQYASEGSQYEAPVPQYATSGTKYTPSVRQYSSQYPSQEYGGQPLEYGIYNGDKGYAKQDFDPGYGGDGGGGGLGGVSGLLGLLGLGGLAGLKAVKPYLLALPFLPILIPFFIFILLLPLLPLILLLPIPVIVSGPNPAGRSFDMSNLFSLNGTDVSFTMINMKSVIPKLASDVLDADECVERISCEIARISRKLKVSRWVDKVTGNLPKDNRYVKKIQKGLRIDRELRQERGNSTAMDKTVKEGPPRPKGKKSRSQDEGGECAIFVCKPKPNFARYLVK